MKKSTVIATCLINCGSPYSMSEIEDSIEQTFREDFTSLDYQQWNTNLPEADAKNIINDFGKGYRIDVRQFIRDLI